MSDHFVQVMNSLAIAGGKISLKMMQDSRPSLKPDQSVLTRADTAVSKLIRQGLQKFLKQPGHLLIDEEDPQSKTYYDQKFLEKHSLIWVIDPIDGTRNFANRMPLYGISIGLLKDLKPYMGSIYFPMLDEMFYADGKKAYFVTGVTTKRRKTSQIKKADQPITRQSVFYGNDGFFRMFAWNFDLCQMMLPSCAVLDLCWPAVGRGTGCFFNANIWDFAGAWPIFRSAGLDLRNVKTGKVLDRLDVSHYLGTGDKTWRLKDYYLLSSNRNFSTILNGINGK